eukprot:14224522-Alexandrium_andersonii.AAC.1
MGRAGTATPQRGFGENVKTLAKVSGDAVGAQVCFAGGSDFRSFEKRTAPSGLQPPRPGFGDEGRTLAR